MGWLFSSRWNSREELREHLVNGNGVKNIKSCWKGNNLWTIGEYTYPEDHAERHGKTILYVGLYLCAKHGKGLDGWGYKDMDESAGPNYRNCPLSYIEMVEAHEKEHGYGPTGYAAEWRQQVRDAKAKASRKLEAGAKIKLYGQPYTVAGRFDSGHYAVLSEQGREFRLKKSQIKDVEVLNAPEA